MKIIKRVEPSSLWAWLKSNLPPTLKAVEVASGYGYALYIYRRGQEPSWAARFLFEAKGQPIAGIWASDVTLYHPEYFSDFMDLLSRFETETGIEPTLEYWESGQQTRAACGS